LARWELPGAFSDALLPVTLNTEPENAFTSALSCQPLAIAVRIAAVVQVRLAFAERKLIGSSQDEMVTLGVVKT
jgi:hypothetical protein